MAPMLERAPGLRDGSPALIRQETETWRQEFQSTLKQIDETARIGKPSTLEVEMPSKSDVSVQDKGGRQGGDTPSPAPRPPPPPRPWTPAPPRAPRLEALRASPQGLGPPPRL